MSERCVRLALALGVLVIAAYFVPGATWSPVSRFCLTRAIVERGTFEITPDAPSTGDRAEVGERFYTDKAPVPSLLAVPAYGLLRAVSGDVPSFRARGTPDRPARLVLPDAAFQRGLYVCAVSTAGVASAALAWALFGVLRRRTSLRVAALGTAATGLATPLVAYATSFFDHTIAASFLFCAFACVDPERRVPSSRGRWALFGALLGLAVGTEYIAVVPAIVVVAFAWVVTAPAERARAAANTVLGALPVVVVVAAYHTICFGAPYRTGYSFITHAAFAAGQARGVFGLTWPRPGPAFQLLFSTSRGLFYVAPITALSLYALGAEASRRKDGTVLLSLAVFVVAWLLNASYFQWDGGRALGPRHMVFALGFLGVGVALAFERFPTLAAVLAGYSVFVVLVATAVGIEAPAGVDVVSGYIVPAYREQRLARAPGASNLGLLVGLGARGSLLALAALVLGFAGVVARLVTRCPSERPDGGQP